MGLIDSNIKEVPVALTIAGFDGSGGAGVLADCRTFHRSGVYGLGALTAVVAQSPGSVSASEPVTESVFQAQLDELNRYPISAGKTGMLATESIIELTASFFEKNEQIRFIVDPVMVASAGAILTDPLFLSVMSRKLFPLAELITPNRFEAEALLDRKIETPDKLKEAALELSNRFGSHFLVKGGHLDSGGEVFDAFCFNGDAELLSSSRLNVPDLHGTGCTLSALITAGLAKQQSVRESVIQGRETLRQWMESRHAWNSTGPIHAINAVDH